MTLESGRGMPDGHGFMRSSSADRDRAIDVLKAAFAEGRLTRDEFEERSGLVLRSQTYAQLAALTADLPVGPFGALMLPQMPYPQQLPYPMVGSPPPSGELARGGRADLRADPGIPGGGRRHHGPRGAQADPPDWRAR